ncbi:hypothetical protein [Methylobacterium gregans]
MSESHIFTIGRGAPSCRRWPTRCSTGASSAISGATRSRSRA